MLRHVAGALDEALGRGARLVVTIPIITLRSGSGPARPPNPRPFTSEIVSRQARELLAALDDAEFGGLLDRIGGVEAGIGKSDDLGLGVLRLQQEGGEVRRVEGHADRAQHLAALRSDDVAGVLFQRIAEGVVRGQEEPCVAAGSDQRPAGADRERARVIGPVEAVGRGRRRQ